MLKSFLNHFNGMYFQPVISFYFLLPSAICWMKEEKSFCFRHLAEFRVKSEWFFKCAKVERHSTKSPTFFSI